MLERGPKNVVVFGNDKFARYAAACFDHESAGRLSVAAFTVTDDRIDEKEKWGKAVAPFEGIEKVYPPEDYAMFVAIGPRKRGGFLNGLREYFCQLSREKGYSLIRYTHPTANIGVDVTMGDNIFIPALNNIDHFVTMGNNVVLWAHNHIGHESDLGDNIFISSGVTISGSCKIGNNSYFGVNSSTADGLTIGPYNMIGMGVPITRSTNPFEVYKPSRVEPKQYDSKEMRGF